MLVTATELGLPAVRRSAQRAPDRPADPVPSPQAGTVLCLRPIARSRPGDCLFQVAPPLPFDTLPRLYDVSCA